MVNLNKTSTVETIFHLTDDIIIEDYHDARYPLLIYERNQTNTFRLDGSLTMFNKKF